MSIKDCYNFVCYGDSISKGIIYDEEKGKYSVLEENFVNIIKDKLNCVIYNAGRFGNTVIKGEKRFQNDVLKREPDIVLIEFGGNDCDFNWDEVANNPQANHEPNTDYNIFQKTLKNLITNLQQIDIVPVLMTLPPLDADKYFKWISKNSSIFEKNILSWLGSVNKIYWWHERYNAAIISIAEETKAKLIDVRSAFLKKCDYRQYICIDGIHPNKEGHKLIADKIMEYIQANDVSILRKATL